MAHLRNFSLEQGPLQSSEQEHLAHYHHDQPHHDSPSTPPRAFPPSHFSSPFHQSRVSPSRHRDYPSPDTDNHFAQSRQAPNNSLASGRHHSSSSSQTATNYQDYFQAPLPPPPPPHRKPVPPPAPARWSGHNQAHPQATRPVSSWTADMDGPRQQLSQRNMHPAGVDAADSRQGGREISMSPTTDAPHSRLGFAAADTTYPSAPSEPSYLPQTPAEASRQLRQQGSHSSSTLPIIAGAATPGSITPILPPSEGSGQGFPLTDYQPRQMPGGQAPYYDSPYQNSSLNFASQVGQANINPQNIADDGDDGFMPDPKRKVLGIRRLSENVAGASAAGSGPPAADGFMGALAGLAGRKQKAQTSSATYGQVAQPDSMHSEGQGSGQWEKSEWLSRQKKGNNKMRWVVGFVIGLVIMLALVGGILGGVLGSRAAEGKRGGSSGSVNNADDDLAANGDLEKKSAEIKALMNNPDLHKVFPAMDYTPWGTQYPLCLTYPPSQNNITRDMAVLSQLTNAVRLYGTDCNQTEMVLHSIDRLDLSSMKVWLGVWIETNTTTNDRQLEQMYTILDQTSDHSVFKGVIVGNEALYRAGQNKAASQLELIQILTDVRSNFSSLGYDLPVTTSDLGDNWDAQLVQAVDVVMSNIHPFFAGVPVEEAAGWTISFWQNKNGPLVAGTDKPQIISETGWPSGGGNDCGTLNMQCPTPESGSVAGIDEMNIFMADFVCQAMDNGTDYFWFEAFDEPWKVVYNTPGQEWEDKWGLMDPARNLKAGLKIPDCGGRTVS